MWILILIYSYLAFRHEQLIYKSQKRRNRSFISIFFVNLPQTMLLFAEEDLQNTHYSFLSLKRQIIVGTKYN